ncbi:MAG: hypothetical protein KDI51_09955 [Xanthomonadales bacterium]|nr:hypothetical protein [Xanthomonadales bacterium]
MRRAHCKIYFIDGAIPPVSPLSIHVDRTNITVSSNIEHVPRQHFRSKVICNSLLRSYFVSGEKWSADIVERDTSEMIQEIENDTNGRCVLTILYTEQVNRPAPSSMANTGEYAIAVENAPIRSDNSRPYDRITQSALTAFSLSLKNPFKACEVFKSSYYIDESDAEIYICRFTASASAMGISPLSEDLAVNLEQWYKLLSASTETDSPSRLLSLSLLQEQEPLSSFLSAWTGLEILVNKTFTYFEGLVPQAIEPHSKAIALRVKEIMKDKYKLSDKFSLVSEQLSPNDAESDQRDFQTIKKIRDSLIHGFSTDCAALPVEETRNLLRKYLLRHLPRLGDKK